MREKIVEAIREGLKARGNGRGYGCGRAYVCLLKVPKKTLDAYKAAAEECGLRYLKEAYGAGNRAIYVGYDNSSGVPLAQSKAIAAGLKAIGLPAYSDAVDD